LYNFTSVIFIPKTSKLTKMKKLIAIRKTSLVAILFLCNYALAYSIAPIITDFSPKSGPVGTSVTISGFYFNATIANNIVFFGATKATVTAASSTSLTVTVPLGASYQPISITDISSGLTAFTAMPFIVTFSGSNAFDSYSFASPVTFPLSGYYLNQLLVGDIDGDGLPDLAATNNDGISVWRNISTIGSFSFSDRHNYNVETTPEDIKMADIDGDGKSDLVVSNSGSNTISILRNSSSSGSVSFAAKVSFATGSNPKGLSVGDFDGDGRPDIAIVNYTSNTVSILRNNSTIGTISFETKIDYAVGSGPVCISNGDLDGDGKLDLAIVNSSSNTISIIRNTSTSGTISFESKIDYNTGQEPSDISIGDFDSDGMYDLVVVNSSSGIADDISIFRNAGFAGTISFAAKVDYNLDIRAKKLIISDLDGNGKPDIAVISFSSSISLIRNTCTIGTISFVDDNNVSCNDGANSFTVGDMNGDEKPDIIVFDYYNNLCICKNVVLPAPTIASYTPTSATSGDVIAVTGTNFKETASIKIGGKVPYSYTVVSSTEITAVIGGGSSGSISVYVPAGGNASKTGFTFTTPPAPTITSFNPTSAGTGDTITITGTNFISATAVKFGGTAATYFKVVSATSIKAVVGAGTTGSVSVTTLGGTVSLAGYTYLLSQTITFSTITAKTYGIADFDPAATASSSLPVTYTSNNPAVATIVSNMIHIVGAGICTIFANQPGNSVYQAAPQVSRNVSVYGKELTISGVTVSNKVYDGTTTASLSSGLLSGIISPDEVSVVSGIGAFADKNIGTGKSVTATSFTLTGANAGNYVVSTSVPGLTADITAATITISGVAANNKAYDGTTSASLTGGTLNGVASSDVVTITYGTGTFADKNIGIGKAVTVIGYSLAGTDAGNYILSAQPSGMIANITPAPITITSVTAINKVYDGTTNAVLTVGTLNGIVNSEDVTFIAGTGTFADINIGSDKVVTASGYSLSGTDAGNYTLSAQPLGLTANITPAPLTISNIKASDKVYDKTDNATLTGGTLNGIVGSEVVNFTIGTGTFADKNIGTGKTITASGYTISGPDAGNYALSQPSGLTANITPVALTITGITAYNKVYDGTTTAILNYSYGALNGVLANEWVYFSNGTGTFADKNVGTGKTVVASGYTISGTDASNYTLIQPSGMTADITPATITITGVTANNKVYDGTTTAILTGGTLNGLIGSDEVTLNAGIGTFNSKDVGNYKTVTASGYLLKGTDAGNYTLSAQPSGLTAEISKALLSISNISANKVYNGNTTAYVTGGTLNGIIGSDVVLFSAGSATFVDKKVGSGKAITIKNCYLYGSDAINYSLSIPPDLTGNITPAPLKIYNVSANNKVYDGTTVASFNMSYSQLSGIIGTDIVTIVTGTGTFDDKNVGEDKSVTTSGFSLAGADSVNYYLQEQPTGIKANITRATLTATAENKTKIYGDNDPIFSINYTGLLNNDTKEDFTEPTASCSATIGDNVGNYDIILNGGSSKNYIFKYAKGTLSITKATLTVTAVDTSREEGNPNPKFRIVYSGFKNTDNVSILNVKPTVSCDAIRTSPVGIYEITPKGGSDNNYDIKYIKGKMTITPATSINNLNKSSISIYPNPVTEKLYIKGINEKEIYIGLFDLSGRLSFTGKVINGELDCQNLKPGIYSLEISNQIFRIIKK
jgi:hypothetical protein